MWEEEAADVEHMTTGQREVLEEAATEAMPEEAATEAVPEERQQSEEPKVRESLIEHVEKLVEQQEFQEEIENISRRRQEHMRRFRGRTLQDFREHSGILRITVFAAWIL